MNTPFHAAPPREVSRRWRAFGIALALLIVVSGCERGPEDKDIALDPTYSINVVAVPPFWPRDDRDWSDNPTIAEIQKETWAREGNPDYLRTVYTHEDRIVHPTELSEGNVLVGRRSANLTEWVYLDEKKVIRFDGANVTESELTDPVRIVCLYGDPNDIKRFEKEAFTETQFFYINHGKIFVFVDGKLQEERNLGTSAPGMTRLR